MKVNPDEPPLKVKVAEAIHRPSVAAALAMSDLHTDLPGGWSEGAGFSTLVKELCVQTDFVLQECDLPWAEAMLISQAHVLQSIFSTLTSMASGTKYLDHMDTYFRIELKAQNQCRQTVSTLAELKHPRRATFIKRQNNAVNQQINQGKQTPKNSDESSNKLLEGKPHEADQWLDTGTPAETVEGDPEMETVAAGHRPKNARGQS